VAGCSEHGNELLRSVKDGGLTERFSASKNRFWLLELVGYSPCTLEGLRNVTKSLRTGPRFVPRSELFGPSY
jgi:hypothetical protein